MWIMRRLWSFISTIIVLGHGCSGAPFSSNAAQDTRNIIMNQRPVGGVRVYQKTTFSCAGRPAGYYADIDAGCEIYHMCDGLGRQFSYACPNTTLFQQRMLICDHWYMVNCSRSQNDYAANLLIGQRDKPFVPDNENELRTPRPDINDRPYSPDYSGESFRKHYKNHAAALENSIAYDTKSTTVQEVIAPIHWGTTVNQNEASQQRLVRDESQNTIVQRRVDETPDPTQATQESQNAVHGVVLLPSPSGFSKTTITKSEDVADKVKIPSVIYELPFFDPDFTKEKLTEKEQELLLKSATTQVPKKAPPSPSGFIKAYETSSNDFSLKHKDYDFSKYFPKNQEKQIKKTITTTTTTTTPAPVTTTTQTTRAATTTTRKVTTTTTRKPTTTTRTTTTTQRPTTEAPKITNVPKEFQNKIVNQDANQNVITFSIPATGLEPPHTEYKTYDDSTTEGPPIYYEWKWAVPAFVLEPPKLNNDQNDTKSSDIDKGPTARSIERGSKTANNPEGDLKFNANFLRKKIPPPQHDFRELKKTFLIPTFDFPLDTETRDSFKSDEAFNSYQLKIPSNNENDRRSWYGENKDCPDCHPAFLQPGTCEPCIRRRR